MKINSVKLIILSIIAIELGGCLTVGTIDQKLTSMHTGCSTEGMQISKNKVTLNGIETWTAKCEGKIYDCDYFSDSEDSHCYLRDE